MDIALLVISLLMFIVGIGSVVVAGRQLREARRLNREALSANRINQTVSAYLELHNGHQCSGVSALIKSDVGGMSPGELDEVVKRITAATGEDPLRDGDIRPFLDQYRISASDFIGYVTSNAIHPRDLTYEKLKEIAAALKSNA